MLLTGKQLDLFNKESNMDISTFVKNYISAEEMKIQNYDKDKKESQRLLHESMCCAIKNICNKNEVLKNIVNIDKQFVYLKIDKTVWYSLILPECAPIGIYFGDDLDFSKDRMLVVHNGDFESDLEYYSTWNFQTAVYQANKVWNNLVSKQKYQILKNMLENWQFVDKQECYKWFWELD